MTFRDPDRPNARPCCRAARRLLLLARMTHGSTRSLATLAVALVCAVLGGACSSGQTPGGDGAAGAGGSAGGGGAAATGGGAGGGGAGVDGGAGGAGGASIDGGAGGAGGAGVDGGGGADGGNAACASAVANGTCTTEGTVCGTCPDACNFCNILRCSAGHWLAQEAAPAPCFDCAGGPRRCQINAEYCRITMGPFTTSAECAAVPAACRPTPTCACLSAQPNCTQADAGALTVTIPAP